jgi:DNA polymerase III alpha subunit
MNYDKYGQAYTTEDELCDMLYQNPNLDLSRFQVSDQPGIYNKSVHQTYADFEQVKCYLPLDHKEEVPIELFDWAQQQNWYMPIEYKELDIAQCVLDLCSTQEELQRVGQELLLFQERDLFNLLRYLKYFVDTMRKNNIVWGLGRGSSTASYVLYLLGVHKINSLYYDLPIEEFLK